MFVQLDRKGGAAQDPFELLLACHGRLHSFTALAARIADAPPGTLDLEIAESAAAVARYYREAAPLHVEDEEKSVHPRARRYLRGEALAAALSEIEAQHLVIEATLEELGALCATVAERPDLRPGLAADIAVRANQLTQIFSTHFPREETFVFGPLRAALPPEEMRALADEMQARRR